MLQAVKTLDVATLDRIAGGAPKPIIGKMGDWDYCDALETRAAAYRELGMTKQQNRVQRRADVCNSAMIWKIDSHLRK